MRLTFSAFWGTNFLAQSLRRLKSGGGVNQSRFGCGFVATATHYLCNSKLLLVFDFNVFHLQAKGLLELLYVVPQLEKLRDNVTMTPYFTSAALRPTKTAKLHQIT